MEMVMMMAKYMRKDRREGDKGVKGCRNVDERSDVR
jgi:hypothetical protein